MDLAVPDIELAQELYETLRAAGYGANGRRRSRRSSDTPDWRDAAPSRDARLAEVAVSAADLFLLLPLAVGGAAINSALSFGQSLVLAPALFAVCGPREAVFISLVLAILVNVLTLAAERRKLHADTRFALAITATSVPGCFAGLGLLLVVPKIGLQFTVGAAVLVTLAFQIRPGGAARRLQSVPLAGLASGCLNASTGLSGPPVVAALLTRGVSGDDLRDTLAAALAGVNCIAFLVLLWTLPESTFSRSVTVIAVLTPAVIVGHRAGRAAFVRLAVRAHQRLTVGAIGLGAVASIVIAIVGWI